jgi:hypothetical protein
MTENTLTLCICTGIYALLVLLILLPTRRQPPNASAGGELRRDLDQILANTQSIKLALDQHRRVLCDAYKRISAVTKWLEKAAR